MTYSRALEIGTTVALLLVLTVAGGGIYHLWRSNRFMAFTLLALQVSTCHCSTS
jgi:hypothetical protein